MQIQGTLAWPPLSLTKPSNDVVTRTIKQAIPILSTTSNTHFQLVFVLGEVTGVGRGVGHLRYERLKRIIGV